VEWSSKRDYQADCRVWESRLQHIANAINAIPGVRAEIYYRKVGNEVPHLAVRWDEQAFGLTKEQCIDALRTGEPHIEVYNGMGRELVRRTDPQPKQERRTGDAPYVISITSNTLQPGDEKLVARRLTEILKPASGRARKA
jgi:L-seryl-tRNA(Ser) seleniumtransferase